MKNIIASICVSILCGIGLGLFAFFVIAYTLNDAKNTERVWLQVERHDKESP